MPTLPWPRSSVGWIARRPLAFLLLVLPGCATSSTNLATKSAGEIPVLTARLARDSADLETRTRLGIAYLQVGRADEARQLLETSVAARPNDANALLHLGLTYEALEQYPEARRLFEQYLQVGRSRDLRADLTRRLALLRRKELELVARQAVEREAQLANTPPRERTVAVFPFHVTQPDSSLRPLGRALAEFMVIDLSQTSRLTVLERLQVQLLLDELELSASGLVDPGQAVRSGHMLGAERIVQGSLAGQAETVELNAAIVQVATAQAATAQPNALSESDNLNRIMAAQKRLVLRVYESLGVILTAAERERVLRQPTENLRAILAYGLGLEAFDAGNYALAMQQFSEAARLDPQFALAREKADQASQTATASATSTTEMVEKASTASTLPTPRALDVFLPTALNRDAVSEVLGTEEARRKTIIELIFRRPN
jgi:tetratricopeptide (TPR) repeat protein